MTDMPTQREMDAFKRGEEAFQHGAELDANPFTEGMSRYDFWMFGWISAKHPSAKNLVRDEEQGITMSTIENQRRILAQKIADALFTSWEEKADRIALKKRTETGERDLGGWCYVAAVDRIEKVLKQSP